MSDLDLLLNNQTWTSGSRKKSREKDTSIYEKQVNLAENRATANAKIFFDDVHSKGLDIDTDIDKSPYDYSDDEASETYNIHRGFQNSSSEAKTNDTGQFESSNEDTKSERSEHFSFSKSVSDKLRNISRQRSAPFSYRSPTSDTCFKSRKHSIAYNYLTRYFSSQHTNTENTYIDNSEEFSGCGLKKFYTKIQSLSSTEAKISMASHVIIEVGSAFSFGGSSVIRLGLISSAEDSECGEFVTRDKLVALKIYKREKNPGSRIMTALDKTILREETIWRSITCRPDLHPNVHKIICSHSTSEFNILVSELASGGSLYNRLLKLENKESRLTYKQISLWSQQLLGVINWFHNSVGIIHGDIKLENCLLMPSRKVHPNLKDQAMENLLVTDFGCAKVINDENLVLPGPSINNINHEEIENYYGSLAYIPPERIKHVEIGVTKAGDVWAYGCSLYTLITRTIPFTHPIPQVMQQKILIGEYQKDILADAVSNMVTEFLVDKSDCSIKQILPPFTRIIEECLQICAEKRRSIAEICQLYEGK